MNLQDQIQSLELKLKGLKEEQQRCPHQWGDTEYAPRETGGYNAKPLHWHPGRECNDIWVPSETHPRWNRTCSVCGLVQHTERTKEVSGRGKLPGTKSKEQVPVF